MKHSYDYDKYDALIEKAAPFGQSELFRAQLFQESAFDEKAINPKTGASGIAQFLPSTFRDWNQGGADSDIFNPAVAIPAAGRYMEYLIKRYSMGATDEDDYNLALAAYNWGLRHVDAAIVKARYKKGDAINYERVANFFPAETRGYVASINKYGGENSGLFRLAGDGQIMSIMNQEYKLDTAAAQADQAGDSSWMPLTAVVNDFKTYAILIPVWAGLGLFSAVAIYFTIKQSVNSKNRGGIGKMFTEGLNTSGYMLKNTINTTKEVFK